MKFIFNLLLAHFGPPALCSLYFLHVSFFHCLYLSLLIALSCDQCLTRLSGVSSRISYCRSHPLEWNFKNHFSKWSKKKSQAKELYYVFGMLHMKNHTINERTTRIRSNDEEEAKRKQAFKINWPPKMRVRLI